MGCIMRKPAFCICENKGADQLRVNCAPDQHLCFRCKVKSLFFLNPRFHVSIHLLVLHSRFVLWPGRKLRRQVFSRRSSNILALFQTFARFPNLCVQHITRKKAADVLAQRIMDAMLLDRKIHSGDFNNVPELTS